MRCVVLARYCRETATGEPPARLLRRERERRSRWGKDVLFVVPQPGFARYSEACLRPGRDARALRPRCAHCKATNSSRPQTMALPIESTGERTTFRISALIVRTPAGRRSAATDRASCRRKFHRELLADRRISSAYALLEARHDDPATLPMKHGSLVSEPGPRTLVAAPLRRLPVARLFPVDSPDIRPWRSP